MWRLFRSRKYRDQNKRHGFLEGCLEGEEELALMSPLSLQITPENRCGIFSWGNPQFKMPQHFLLCVSVSLAWYAKRVVKMFRAFMWLIDKGLSFQRRDAADGSPF